MTMNDVTGVPLRLYRANLELQARIGSLLQQSGTHWLDFAQRLAGDGIAESNAELATVLKAGDWEKLATLPVDIFWRQLQQRVGDSQEAAQIAVNAQTEFAGGVQEALIAWQKETAEALASAKDAGVDAATLDAWRGLQDAWAALLQPPGTGAPPPKKPAGARKQ
ncbi:phasin family protein [Luteimonas sp. BDR2-5]|uniref:phasin family protein n=1 Tax=Proluteimonas luteida TaxID=2878685 RepID=UPI001E3F03DF|nr:phasin family protein [Luteimonas sp. BDR2-5]MCD9029036.1 phasin family protein [Luteimonas sp. BDR2-5]